MRSADVFFFDRLAGRLDTRSLSAETTHAESAEIAVKGSHAESAEH